ncbi:MAG: hypothetical protein JO208_09035 [Alphaproteobacteria bacterium]|nr:hypothetical protein [Alphaproteobacteria bacterium]
MNTRTAMAVVLSLLPTPALAQQNCLVSAQIWSWNPLNRKTLIVQDTIHRQFKVTLYGPCPGIDYNIGAAIVSHGNTALDCVRPGDVVVHRGYGMGNRCLIKSVEPYTGAMQKADEATRTQSQ